MVVSTHKCEVVQLDEAFPIENADRILRVDVFGGYPCIVGKADFKPGSLWIYVPPDSLVPVRRKEFDFLASKANKDGFARIRTIRLRKQTSMGLLIPAPAKAKVGQDLADSLGVKHYEPPVKGPQYTKPRSKIQKWIGIIARRSYRYGERPPNIHVPHYDVDALRRFKYAYEGKQVVVTEKVHGSNVAYTWQKRGLLDRILYKKDGFRVRSRTVWQKTNKSSWYTNAATKNIKDFTKLFPELVLFGEVYGPMIQSGFDYGVTEPTFIAFDIWNAKFKRWLSHDDFLYWTAAYDIPRVPVLATGEFDFDLITELAEGKSLIGGSHVREGVVVSVVGENELVRQLKVVGLGYYAKED